MLYNETLIRVHVKINTKASVLNMNCCRALTVNLQKVFYNSQAIQLVTGNIQLYCLYALYFCPQYLIILIMTERGSAISFVGF